MAQTDKEQQDEAEKAFTSPAQFLSTVELFTIISVMYLSGDDYTAILQSMSAGAFFFSKVLVLFVITMFSGIVWYAFVAAYKAVQKHRAKRLLRVFVKITAAATTMCVALFLNALMAYLNASYITADNNLYNTVVQQVLPVAFLALVYFIEEFYSSK